MALPPTMTAPRSVAVVGASDDPAKWGYWLAAGALAGRGQRDVWLVNRHRATLLEQPAYASVAELPCAPDLMALAVPSQHLCACVEEAIALGTRSFLAVSAGLTESEEQRLSELLAISGATMLGPNSLGMYDADAAISLAWGRFEPGSLAIVSQSGQLGLEIANLASRSGIGVSRFYSVGNQTSITAADVLESLVDHERTDVVALYLEGFADGDRLVTAMRALRAAGKSTLVLTTGASEGSRRLARSHTGSMTSAADVVDAACRAAGSLRVTSPRELVDTAALLRTSTPPAGPRIGIISDSGGQGGIAADVAVGAGLVVPAFTEDLQRAVESLLSAGAAAANPIDLAGAGEADLETYLRLVETLTDSGQVDVVVLSGYLGCYGADTPALLDRELDVIRRIGETAGRVPVVIHTMSAHGPAVDAMWRHGLPAYADIDTALGAVARAVLLAGQPGRNLAPSAVEAAPPAAPGYWEARAVLATLGVLAPPAVRVCSREDLADARDLTPPLVLKADWLEHKSEHGGVRIGLGDHDALKRAYEEMTGRLGGGTYVVEEQDLRDGVVEMIVGARQDRDFGSTVTVGLGGTEAELWRDTCTELAPVSQEVALRMIATLKARVLLEGWRGRPAVDLTALADVVVAASHYIVATDEVDEIEVNPLRVGPVGALAVDALIVTSPHLIRVAG